MISLSMGHKTQPTNNKKSNVYTCICICDIWSAFYIYKMARFFWGRRKIQLNMWGGRCLYSALYIIHKCLTPHPRWARHPRCRRHDSPRHHPCPRSADDSSTGLLRPPCRRPRGLASAGYSLLMLPAENYTTRDQNKTKKCSLLGN